MAKLMNRFFSFPLSNPILTQKWVHGIGRRNWMPSSNNILCSLHFSSEQFISQNGEKILKVDAVPSILPSVPKPMTSYRSIKPKNVSERDEDEKFSPPDHTPNKDNKTVPTKENDVIIPQLQQLNMVQPLSANIMLNAVPDFQQFSFIQTLPGLIITPIPNPPPQIIERRWPSILRPIRPKLNTVIEDFQCNEIIDTSFDTKNDITQRLSFSTLDEYQRTVYPQFCNAGSTTTTITLSEGKPNVLSSAHSEKLTETPHVVIMKIDDPVHSEKKDATSKKVSFAPMEKSRHNAYSNPVTTALTRIVIDPEEEKMETIFSKHKKKSNLPSDVLIMKIDKSFDKKNGKTIKKISYSTVEENQKNASSMSDNTEPETIVTVGKKSREELISKPKDTSNLSPDVIVMKIDKQFNKKNCKIAQNLCIGKDSQQNVNYVTDNIEDETINIINSQEDAQNITNTFSVPGRENLSVDDRLLLLGIDSQANKKRHNGCPKTRTIFVYPKQKRKLFTPEPTQVKQRKGPEDLSDHSYSLRSQIELKAQCNDLINYLQEISRELKFTQQKARDAQHKVLQQNKYIRSLKDELKHKGDPILLAQMEF